MRLTDLLVYRLYSLYAVRNELIFGSLGYIDTETRIFRCVFLGTT
jgi:hypothetical protein